MIHFFSHWFCSTLWDSHMMLHVEVLHLFSLLYSFPLNDHTMIGCQFYCWKTIGLPPIFSDYEHYFPFYSFLFYKRFYLFIFREKGREGEREEQKHQCVVASYTPSWGPGLQRVEPETLLCRPVVNPLSNTNQGWTLLFECSWACLLVHLCTNF